MNREVIDTVGRVFHNDVVRSVLVRCFHNKLFLPVPNL